MVTLTARSIHADGTGSSWTYKKSFTASSKNEALEQASDYLAELDESDLSYAGGMIVDSDNNDVM